MNHIGMYRKAQIVFLLLVSGAAISSSQTAPASSQPVKAIGGEQLPMKLPSGIAPATTPVMELFALRYEDIRVGTGALAAPSKLYKVHYTAWLARDGRKIDSSYDHPGPPVLDKTGKPVLDAAGKIVWADPPPVQIPQDYGYVIAGWDQGFYGMRVGGKRRLFIPYQLAYGARGRPGPDAAHPGIPPKSDMIYDIELVEVAELPEYSRTASEREGTHR